MLVLPSLLLTLDKWSTTRAFEDPLVDIYEDHADIDLEEKNRDPRGIESQKK
jgi:hypothetical protein